MNRKTVIKLVTILTCIVVVGYALDVYVITPWSYWSNVYYNSSIDEGTFINNDYANITNIYAIQCPFGQYWTDTEGSISFGFGSVSTTLQETYEAKYMVGNVLNTIDMPVSSSSVVIDGHFYITEVIPCYGDVITKSNNYPYYAKAQNNPWEENFVYNPTFEKWISGYTIGSWNMAYIIHLPYLPKLASNMTSSWGGS